ncbi:MAG: 16S rRNA (guanine(527)-N(7))-methyltransferase RsmG [Bacilli bacterium]|nr:16S rRNA (guanine(527)-N(7))-methyltransferase RsmG [Bacilli bacterium]
MNNLLEEFNITSDTYELYDRYYNLLVETNKVMNLTSITNYEDVYIKHFYDSLLLNKCNNNLDDIIDVGSGAGFPGMVLAINNPNLKITLLEPTKKRANFLENVKKELNLTNIKVIADRAENIKGSYSYATARAVAPLNILIELIAPLLKVGGKFYSLKGSSYQEELEASEFAIKELNLNIEHIYHFDLPNNLGKRVIIEFTKTKANHPKYPRAYAKILKQPL